MLRTMPGWVLVALLAAFAFCAVNAGGGGGDDTEIDDPDVLKLNNDNFDVFVMPEELILVEFYAPWCGHCKRLAPDYAKAATMLKSHDPPIKLAKVDATKAGETAGRFGVQGYPTLKVFRSGQPSDYKGPRDAEGIVGYMKKQVGPAAKPVESEADLKKYLDQGDRDLGSAKPKFWILGFFKSGSPSALQASFSIVSNKLREDYVFLKSTNADLAKKYDADGEGIVAVKNFDEGNVKYTGGTQTSKLEDWIASHSLPLVGEYGQHTAAQYQKRGLPVLRVFTKVDWSEKNLKHTQYYINRVKDVATQKRSKLLVALSDEGRSSSELDLMGLKGKVTPIVIEDGSKKYVSTEKYTAENVKKFVEKWEKGEAEKFVKSEEPPKDNDGPVTVVTGKTFDELVEDDETDVLIEFYAPWCGHCKSLAPKYDELGKKMKKKYKNVRIAKMDATANDYPSDKYQVQGYPTILFKPAGASKPMTYDGEREAEAMADYVKKHGRALKKKGKKDKDKKKKKKRDDDDDEEDDD